MFSFLNWLKYKIIVEKFQVVKPEIKNNLKKCKVFLENIMLCMYIALLSVIMNIKISNITSVLVVITTTTITTTR